MPRILLIDDHAMVREGFRRLLEEADGFEVVAEAGTPGEALAAARDHEPDLALVDLSLGCETSGLVLLLQLHESHPEMRCVVLSMHDDPGLVVRALDVAIPFEFGVVVPAGRPVAEPVRALSEALLLAARELPGCVLHAGAPGVSVSSSVASA